MKKKTTERAGEDDSHCVWHNLNSNLNSDQMEIGLFSLGLFYLKAEWSCLLVELVQPYAIDFISPALYDQTLRHKCKYVTNCIKSKDRNPDIVYN